MKTISMKSFGDFLTSREDGQQAYEVIKREISNQPADLKVLFIFDEIKVLAPSYCDEVFGKLEEDFPGRLVYDGKIGHALKVAFETVSETRKIYFHFIP